MTNLKSTPFICLFICLACTMEPQHPEEMSADEQAVRDIHQAYVEGWKKMDEVQVLALFEEGARIQPNRMSPIEGKEAIRSFWFPDDGSITRIHRYETDLMFVEVMDSLAVSTQKSLLDWSYEQDTFQMARIQRGLATTLYRKQSDGHWKIWRQMWTDYWSEGR